jgi:hypothetical protein
MKLRNLVVIGVVLVALRTTQAAVIFNLTPSVLNTSPGGTVEFTGTLTNTGSTEVFLNGDSASLLSPFLTLDDTPFFANAPLSLAAGGGSYSGPFFDVIVDPTALPNIYSSSFTIQGGADSNAFDNLATRSFEVVVTSVPEPKVLPVVLMGLLLIALGKRLVVRPKKKTC